MKSKAKKAPSAPFTSLSLCRPPPATPPPGPTGAPRPGPGPGQTRRGGPGCWGGRGRWAGRAGRAGRKACPGACWELESRGMLGAGVRGTGRPGGHVGSGAALGAPAAARLRGGPGPPARRGEASGWSERRGRQEGTGGQTERRARTRQFPGSAESGSCAEPRALGALSPLFCLPGPACSPL